MNVAANKSKDDTKTVVKQTKYTLCTRQGSHCLRGVTVRSAHNMGASIT